MERLGDNPALTFSDHVKGCTAQPVAHVDDGLGIGGSGQDILPLGRDLVGAQYTSESLTSGVTAVLTRSLQPLKTGNRALSSGVPKAGRITFL